MTVNKISRESLQSATKGNEQMSELVQAMKTMSASAAGIKKIVKTIDDIAFQINLLALNANVEAARAGKYGKGFAVVADEVRNLAVRSASSVKETTEMVENTIKSIENCDRLALVTSEQLKTIVKGATQVASLADEVSESSREQTKSLGQITSGLDQINSVTQSNTANAEQTAAASEELSSQAQFLKSLISRFQIKLS